MASVLTRAEARRWMLGHLGLRRVQPATGAAGVRALLGQLRCIQLDPLDPIGTNADLVALARVDGIARGDVYRHLLPGHAFEHYAKERCLLPAMAFPYYRDHLVKNHWWTQEVRAKRVPPRVVKAVLAQIRAHGPLTPADLEDHGAVKPINWSSWKGTAKAASMAVEILWARCEVVVCGRTTRGKLFDIPGRALPHVADAPSAEFARWALLERVEATGLLNRNAGAHWSMLSDVRTAKLPDELIAEGLIEEVTIEGAKARYLTPAGFRDRVVDSRADWDGRLRILAPLDPLLWDRKLVAHIFDFEYVWEIYKPPATRKYGWYVHPLLHGDRFVGRLEGRIRDGALHIDNLWPEPGVKLPIRALTAALTRHATACHVPLSEDWKACLY